MDLRGAREALASLLPRISLKLKEEDEKKKGKTKRIRGRSEDGEEITQSLHFDLASVTA
jgi:hypothetical protein